MFVTPFQQGFERVLYPKFLSGCEHFGRFLPVAVAESRFAKLAEILTVPIVLFLNVKVYEDIPVILPMCGPDFHPTRLGDYATYFWGNA